MERDRLGGWFGTWGGGGFEDASVTYGTWRAKFTWVVRRMWCAMCIWGARCMWRGTGAQGGMGSTGNSTLTVSLAGDDE